MATDITGYRSEGGALGQQQNVSDQLRKILMNKTPLLNSPGTVIENSLYYDVTSSSVSAVEAQETFCKDRINMSSFTFGSSPTAYIPSVLMAGSTFLVATLPNLKYSAGKKFSDIAASPASNYFYAPQGWLFNCIQSVIVYMGACSIAQIEIDGWSNFMIALACCETLGKRKQMIVQAGEMLWNNHDNSTSKTKMGGFNSADIKTAQVDDATYNPDGSIFIMNKHFSGDRMFYTDDHNWCYYPMATAIVPIRLPFSGMAALEKKLSYDTKLTTQPIQITIQLKSFSECFKCGSDIQPSNPAFSSLSLQLWQQELSDKSLSVRNELLAMPQFNVGYPFQYTQSIPFPVTSDNSNGLGQTAFNQNQYNQTQITMNITSIINSDLTTMLFMLTWEYRSSNKTLTVPFIKDSKSTEYYDANQFCPLYGEKLTNMQLYLNGQRFFSFEQDIYAGATLSKQLDQVNTPILLPRVTESFKSWSQSNPDMDFVSADSNVYELNMSRLRSLVCESHMQNTARFTNQTFQLVFNVERNLYYPRVTNSSLKSACTLHMAYEYNAVLLSGGDGGTTKLVTN